MKYAAALTLTGALAVTTATPSQAAHGRNAGAPSAVLRAGALVGAAAANATTTAIITATGRYAYAPGYYAYDYAPAPVYGYARGPRYYYGPGNSSEGNCTISPGSGRLQRPATPATDEKAMTLERAGRGPPFCVR